MEKNPEIGVSDYWIFMDSDYIKDDSIRTLYITLDNDKNKYGQ